MKREPVKRLSRSRRARPRCAPSPSADLSISISLHPSRLFNTSDAEELARLIIARIEEAAEKLRKTARELRTAEEAGGINRWHAAARLMKLADGLAPAKEGP
jgi:hypothetical protein